MQNPPSDRFDLERFVAAQAPVHGQVESELRAGRKRSHWMWFVFPQIAGLGVSETSRRYAIASLDEARDYLAHPVLGPRLLEDTRLASAGASAAEVFAHDDIKFHACMTLFARAAPDEPLFSGALDHFFGGAPHAQTLALLAADAPGA